jgi:hypothetical protein
MIDPARQTLFYVSMNAWANAQGLSQIRDNVEVGIYQDLTVTKNIQPSQGSL